MARLSDPITMLKGIGPTKAKQFANLNIFIPIELKHCLTVFITAGIVPDKSHSKQPNATSFWLSFLISEKENPFAFKQMDNLVCAETISVSTL